MSFALGLLLIPYAIVVLLFSVLAVLNVYHLVHYGATTQTSLLFTLIFVAGTALIALASWQALVGIDWTAGINLNPFAGAATELPQI
ncbi:MAG: hypothetical protein V1738_06580 [Patescibacteria group bacterium]